MKVDLFKKAIEREAQYACENKEWLADNLVVLRFDFPEGGMAYRILFLTDKRLSREDFKAVMKDGLIIDNDKHITLEIEASYRYSKMMQGTFFDILIDSRDKSLADKWLNEKLQIIKKYL